MKKNIFPLFSAADSEAVQPILEALKTKGVRTAKKTAPGKGEVVLLFLSKAFAADEELQQRFFAADSAHCAVIPVDLDGAEQSELVRSALMAKNAIAAQGRTTEELAARVASSDAIGGGGGSRLPRILIAAAVVLALGAALWLWRSRAPEPAEEQPSAVPAMAESDIAAARRLGLTPEDLERITSFCIVGDVHGTTTRRYTTDSSINPGLRVYLDDLAYDSEEMDGRHWYSTEDGHEFTLTHYDDLSVIELMPNLRSLTLVLVETDKLPSLAGLEKLEELRLENCRLGDLAWVADGSFLQFSCRGCDVEDFSPLGSCRRLSEAEFELDAVTRADFSGAGASYLHNVSIRGGDRLREIDLSGLRNAVLWELRLTKLPVSDLSFLTGQASLSELELNDLDGLRSIGPVGNLPDLTWVQLKDLQSVNDLTPLGRCSRLKEFQMENMRQIHDLDFLLSCTSLARVSLGGCDIEDLDFLETMSKNFGTELSVSGRVGDWSGLSYNSFFGSLSIWVDDRRISGVLSYLENCSVSSLWIGNAADLDLSALPKISSRLTLHKCPNLEDLTGLQDGNNFTMLELQDLPRLRSLNGLQKVRAFGRSDGTFNCELWVENCPRLEDWSAVNRAKFKNIRLRSVYTLPAFEKLQYSQHSVLRLESIPDLEDLSCLDGIKQPESINFSFELVGLDDMKDIGALRRFRGDYIAVTPELQDQAEALVEAKRFNRMEIAYPSGGWNNDYDDFCLVSLEELDTLSDKVLGRVTSLCLAGDRIVDLNSYEVWDEWDGRKHHTLIVERDGGEKTEVSLGGYADLSALSKLTGLRKLELYAMPLTSLDGIQVFGELEELRILNCPKLTDAGAAFTLQGLRSVEIGRCPISSIRGVQNLTELHNLSIYETKVTDLSPLRELDYAAAMEEGGFSLSVGGTQMKDYSPIEAIPALSFLDLNGVDFRSWPDLTQVGQLRRLTAHGDNMTQEGFEAILAAHPELEELEIPWGQRITDLSPLLEMPNLRYVLVSKDLSKALKTIDTNDLPFELEIW